MSSEPSGADPSPPPAAQAASRIPRGRLRILLGFCLLAGLFSLALWGSWRFRPERSDGSDLGDPPLDPVRDMLREHAKASPAEVLARGDNALQQLRTAEALSHYKDFLATGATQSAEITYRLSLC